MGGSADWFGEGNKAVVRMYERNDDKGCMDLGFCLLAGMMPIPWRSP